MGEWFNNNYKLIYGDIPITGNFEVNFISHDKKPNNNALKSIKGDYTLSIHGNKIVLVDGKDGTTVEAKCHPDDEFDIKAGIEEAFKKLNEKREELRKQKEEEDKRIKVGDWVEVVKNGRSYSTRASFFEKNDILQYSAKFRYGVCPRNGTKGRVVFIANEKEVEDSIAVIRVPTEKYYGASEFLELNCYDAIYLVSVKGLRKVAEAHV